MNRLGNIAAESGHMIYSYIYIYMNIPNGAAAVGMGAEGEYRDAAGWLVAWPSCECVLVCSSTLSLHPLKLL